MNRPILLLFVGTVVAFSGQKRGWYCTQIRNTICYPLGHDPQCGSNNFTYYNKCEFSQDHCLNPNIHLSHKGPCNALSPGYNVTHGQEVVLEMVCKTLTAQHCPDDFNEVCASDGNTYINHCYFEIHRCLHPHLSILAEGTCLSPVG